MKEIDMRLVTEYVYQRLLLTRHRNLDRIKSRFLFCDKKETF